MTTSSEDVLLSVSNVRYKKGDGTLYVMNQRLAWMLENRDTVAVSHKYADIKSKWSFPSFKDNTASFVRDGFIIFRNIDIECQQ